METPPQTSTSQSVELQPEPAIEPPKRPSPVRFLVPILGAPVLGALFVNWYYRSGNAACDGLGCIGTGIEMAFFTWLVIPILFGIVGAAWDKHSRIGAGLAWLALAFAASIVGAYLLAPLVIPEEARLARIYDFEDCVEAGYPVMESYPRQCRTPDGRTFVEEIADRWASPSPSPIPSFSDEPVACTADAFQCPDGSWVGRTGPRCEFVCP